MLLAGPGLPERAGQGAELWEGLAAHGDMASDHPERHGRDQGSHQDVIKTGEWIAPLALESLISAHAAVHAVAVIGVPDAQWGAPSGGGGRQGRERTWMRRPSRPTCRGSSTAAASVAGAIPRQIRIVQEIPQDQCRQGEQEADPGRECRPVAENRGAVIDSEEGLSAIPTA